MAVCRRPVLVENPTFTQKVAHEQKEKFFAAELERLVATCQHFRLNTDPNPVLDPDPGFDDQNRKKLQLKILFFFIKNCNLLISRPPKRKSKLQEKPLVLKQEHPALQNIKFLTFSYFCWSFLS
jgi:hypothetical protein